MKYEFKDCSLIIVMKTHVLDFAFSRSWDGRWEKDGRLLKLFGFNSELKEIPQGPHVTRFMMIYRWWMPFFYFQIGSNVLDKRRVVLNYEDVENLEVLFDGEWLLYCKKNGVIDRRLSREEIEASKSTLIAGGEITVDNRVP